MKLHGHAIAATWRRQLFSLISNPLAYVFILAFVMATVLIMFYDDDFGKRNIADLGPLRDYMLAALVVLIPALSMGSWASERELGTEEQLLSLPMTIGDVLIGKWLGITTFFLLTLACSWCNVFILVTMGDPDLGLIIAHYVGWTFAGLFFISLSILASSLVSMPAIGFVLGVVFSAVGAITLHFSDWLVPFNRGLIPVPSILMTVLLVAAPLGVAAVCLSMRRWQSKQANRFANMIIAAFCFCIVAFNVFVLLDRLALDVDITEERLSSISPASSKVIKGIERQVEIVAFISEELPTPQLASKAREVETMLQSMDRMAGKKIAVQIKRPTDVLDDVGIEATEHYGLQPRPSQADDITGKQMVSVFLGAVVQSASKTQIIEHFDPGLSVEYELIRAIRTVGHESRKVIGIVENEFQVQGGYDYQTRQMRREWDLVKEIKKQYEVRSVNLSAAVDKEIDALVVIQMSQLKEEHIRNLHNAIWDGVPTLIMEDPLPMFAGAQLGSSQARKPPQQNPMQPQQQPPEPKGNIQPIINALGLTYVDSDILWTTYNPSHEFRDMPRDFVWTYRAAGGIKDSDITTGIDGLLFPFPGGFEKNMFDKDSKLEITPLVSTMDSVSWGRTRWDQHFQRSFFGMQQTNPPYRSSFGAAPMIATHVSGKMKRAYDLPNQEAPAADATKEGEEQAKPDTGKGKLSEADVSVVLIADTDFAHDQFYSIYRNPNNAYSEDALAVLHGLRNVQFIANAIDGILGDGDFLNLRTRRAKIRPLTWMNDVQQKQRKEQIEAESQFEQRAQDEINKLNQRMQEKVDAIRKLDEDEATKRQRVAQLQEIEQRNLQASIEKVNRQKNKDINAAKIKATREVRAAWNEFKLRALGLPAVLLILLILGVYVMRMREEQTAVPSDRKRSDS